MKPVSSHKITVLKNQAGQRLDVFLSGELKISRSQTQKMIDDKQVLINKKLTKKAAERLRADDVIVIAKSEAIKQPRDNSESSQKKGRRSRASVQTEAPTMIPKIISDTPDYIVVSKPTGMLTHPTMANEKNTLADFITKKYPKIKKVGDDPGRPGIVHRLDKEASGLMVIAKTTTMFNHLKEQFKNRTIEKEYIALVHGQVARDWGEINFPIARSETSDRMAAIPETDKGKSQLHAAPLGRNDAREAKTEFLVEKKFINFTLLRVKIYTGRMHQIRVHLLAYNHPLVGDPLYFQKKQKRVWDKKLGRLFLHSTKLGFTDLESNVQTFSSPLPQELKDFLKLLK